MILLEPMEVVINGDWHKFGNIMDFTHSSLGVAIDEYINEHASELISLIEGELENA